MRSLRWMWAPRSADATLLQFPAIALRNKYFLVRLFPSLASARHGLSARLQHALRVPSLFC